MQLVVLEGRQFRAFQQIPFDRLFPAIPGPLSTLTKLVHFPPGKNVTLFARCHRVRGLGSGRLSEQSGLALAFQSVALSFDVEGCGMMQQPVENGGGQHLVAKDLTPAVEQAGFANWSPDSRHLNAHSAAIFPHCQTANNNVLARLQQFFKFVCSHGCCKQISLRIVAVC